MPKTSPMLWAALAAILANVIIFDLLVLGEDAGLREIIIAGALGLTAAVAILLIARALVQR